VSEDKLEKYRAKRSPDRTPEPFGAGASPSGRLYVMQKHAARNLHYDLRLELDGVLKSWAVPKDPSYDQTVKRAAFHVEDHPVEYAMFEGVIPKGNYGAGEVIVWDRGVWIPLEDPHTGFEKGKLLFELRGHRMRGKWTLVKVKRGENEWLLIKERDSLEGPDRDTFTHDSILTGRTLEDMRAGRDVTGEITRELIALKAPKRAVRAADVELMLAETRKEAFDHADWVFELKYDGYRILAGRDDGEIQLLSRNGNDMTSAFPEIEDAVARLCGERFVLDGEVVVHDDAGRPSFQRLQKRARFLRPTDTRRTAAEHPATVYVFDLLAWGDHDLRPLPLRERKRLLRMLLPSTGVLRYSEHIEERGSAFYAFAEQMQLEGIVGKRADSPYRSGRSRDWVKIRASLTDDFIIIGVKASKSAKGTYGSFHVAQYENGKLVSAGSVGTGVTPKHIDEVLSRLKPAKKPDIEVPMAGREDLWCEPEIVIEVRYLEWTDAGQLRHPVFLRFRDDKNANECIRKGSSAPELDELPIERAPAKTAKPKKRIEAREVRFTNLDKVLWPEDGYTKGDLVAYYRAVAPWILPYLKDRPVVLTRFPDGIHGKSFFQKDAPEWSPSWLRTETIYSEGSERDLRYFVVDDATGLEYLANAASIPLHIWSSRLPSIERPDWSSIDLDPKGAPFEHVVDVANAVHALCDEIGLPCFVKSTGSSGLHVLLPMGGQCTHEQARLIAELLAREIVRELPQIATIARVISQREGKVYLDYLQNGHGKLLVSPFCVRPLPGAPVSVPLLWSEVNHDLNIRTHTIRNVIARMERLKEDPLRGVLAVKPNLVNVLSALQRRQ
jgi:bifunctional non-homologous end joining protein LigD